MTLTLVVTQWTLMNRRIAIASRPTETERRIDTERKIDRIAPPATIGIGRGIVPSETVTDLTEIGCLRGIGIARIAKGVTPCTRRGRRLGTMMTRKKARLKNGSLR